MLKTVNKIDLTKEETAYLESILRQATREARVYVRAKILLLKHNGYTNEGSAYKLDVSLSSVKLCLRKFSDGVEGNLRPFEGISVHTLSYDEKPGIQTVGTAGKDRSPVPDTEKTVRSSATTSMSALACFLFLRA